MHSTHRTTCEFSLDYVIIWQAAHFGGAACDISKSRGRKEKAKCSRIAISVCFLSAGCQQVIGLHTNDVSV